MVKFMNIRKNISETRRGSMAVEAAILLPLLIIGILTLGYLLKFCMVSEGVHHALTDEAHRAMTEAPALVIPVVSEQSILKRIADESRGDVQGAKADRFLYPAAGVSVGGRAYTHLIAISVSYDTPLKLPRLFLGEIKGERSALARAFVGKTQGGAAMPFSEMEDGGGGPVWIFPRAGERYHGAHCSYIENNPREVLLSSAIRSRYAPCKLCSPSGRRDGTLVYCFETSGRAYHLAECTLVERYVIEVSRDDAEKQGYTACSKCGGG